MRSLHQIALVIAVVSAGCSTGDLAAGRQAAELATRVGDEPAAPQYVTAEPRTNANLAFDGSWAVSWCDRNRPERECGRFNLQLVQDGETLCGSYFGARPGLSQVDEGDARAVKGQVLGDTAVLTVRSGRSGVIYLVRLLMDSDNLRWKVVDTVLDGNGDVDVVASDTTMRRDTGSNAQASHRRDKADCNQAR